MILTTDILQDKRLLPLSQPGTVLMLQFFVLEIFDKTKKKSEFNILYGWCIASARGTIDDKFYSADPDMVHDSNSRKLLIHRINLYNTFTKCTGLLNELLAGKSIKESCDKLMISPSQLKFDVSYINSTDKKSNFSIRPIIFCEPTPFIDVYSYKYHALKSPYKEAPCYSLLINRHNKLSILGFEKEELIAYKKEILKTVLTYLTRETTINFQNKECMRLGNLEILSCPVVDQFGNPYVEYKCIKEAAPKKYSTNFSATEILITIKDNPLTINKNLLINCTTKNGNQIILDECRLVQQTGSVDLNISFKAAEQISDTVISIWIEVEPGKFEIWYKHAGSFLRSIQAKSGLISKKGSVDSEWLKVIKASNKKTELLVEKAKETSRASYQSFEIGGHTLDPWVAADREFANVIDTHFPQPSEAAFFSKGWNAETAEHGAISFLDWFKKITHNTEKIVILDPFFDTLGLEFLGRTSDAGTEFLIVTCTQIMSNDDEKLKRPNIFERWALKLGFKKVKSALVSEPNRAKRIKSFINQYPSIFEGLHCEIYDLRSKGGGDKNIIHDRYVLEFKNESVKKGFHLSNSIQGATKSHPLLITPIPNDTLEAIDNYLTELLTNSANINVIQLYNSKASSRGNTAETQEREKGDDLLSQQLNIALTVNDKKFDTTKFNINAFTDELLNANQSFTKKWISLSAVFANSFDAKEKFMPVLLSKKNETFVNKLFQFIKFSIDPQSGIVYANGNHQNNYLYLIKTSFEYSLDYVITQNEYLKESFGLGSWGLYYACDLLSQLDFDVYLQISLFLDQELTRLPQGIDLSDHRLNKLGEVYFDRLLKRMYFSKEETYIEKVLSSACLPLSLKGAAAAAAICRTISNFHKIDIDKVKDWFKSYLTPQERINALCKWLKLITRRKADVTIQEKIIGMLANEAERHYSQEVITFLIDEFIKSPIDDIEKKITEQILLNLVNKNIIDHDNLFEIWAQQLLTSVRNKESFSYRTGLIDITAWSFCYASTQMQTKFIRTISKEIKPAKMLIWKPFFRNSVEWLRSFEKLFIFRTVLMIAILYKNKDTNISIDTNLINPIIEEINVLEKNYRPHLYNERLQLYFHDIKIQYTA